MIDLHPGIPDVNTAFGDVNQQIAPVAGFDTSRFVAEAKAGMSTWDLYLGATPFVDMAALVKTGAIEPWDEYIPKMCWTTFSPQSVKKAPSTANCITGLSCWT